MRVMEGSAALRDFPPLTPAYVQPAGVDETTAALARAERLLEQSRYAEVVASIASVHVPTVSSPALAVRVLHCEAWARLYLGDLGIAEALCERGRALTEGPVFTEDDRAEALFRLATCRLKLGRTSNAVSLLGEAIRLGGDRVRARAHEWRARCYVLQREWDSAQSDAERAAELARSLGDLRLRALAKMQCSVIAERRGDPRLARYYAERARTLAAESGDRQTEARLLNN